MRNVRVVRSAVLVATALGMLVAPAIAQDGTEHQVTRLGGTTRFSQPLRTVDDLHAMVIANRSAIRSVMVMAGYGDVSAQLADGSARIAATGRDRSSPAVADGPRSRRCSSRIAA